MPDDERCGRHEDELRRLDAENRALLGQLSAGQVALVGVEHDIERLSERIPTDLKQWMGRIDERLAGFSVTLNDVVQALQRGYVTTAEFDILKKQLDGFARKEELEPIKMAFYKALGVLLTAIIGAVLAMVLTRP